MKAWTVLQIKFKKGCCGHNKMHEPPRSNNLLADSCIFLLPHKLDALLWMKLVHLQLYAQESIKARESVCHSCTER